MKRCLILLLLAALPAALSATTVIPMDVEQLTQHSTHIVEARALESVSQWNAEHTLIFTYTKFQTLRTLKGELPNIFMVRQLGGTVGDTTQKVAGIRHWRVGDESVLFLQPGSLPDGALVVTGLMQGNYLIRRTAQGQALVSNGMPDASEYHAATGETTTFKGSKNLSLTDLEARIAKAVQR